MQIFEMVKPYKMKNWKFYNLKLSGVGGGGVDTMYLQQALINIFLSKRIDKKTNKSDNNKEHKNYSISRLKNCSHYTQITDWEILSISKGLIQGGSSVWNISCQNFYIFEKDAGYF